MINESKFTKDFTSDSWNLSSRWCNLRFGTCVTWLGNLIKLVINFLWQLQSWCSSLELFSGHTGFFKKNSHPQETTELPCLPPQPPTSMLWSEVPNIINRNGCFFWRPPNTQFRRQHWIGVRGGHDLCGVVLHGMAVFFEEPGEFFFWFRVHFNCCWYACGCRSAHIHTHRCDNISFWNLRFVKACASVICDSPIKVDAKG